MCVETNTAKLQRQKDRNKKREETQAGNVWYCRAMTGTVY